MITTTLLGKLLTRKLFNRNAFRTTIKELWLVVGRFLLSMVARGIFLFAFANEFETKVVIEKDPFGVSVTICCYYNQLFFLQMQVGVITHLYSFGFGFITYYYMGV